MEVIRESPILRAREVKKSSVKTRQGFTMCKTTGAAAQPPLTSAWRFFVSPKCLAQGSRGEALNV
jgi:hypothetical protein